MRGKKKKKGKEKKKKETTTRIRNLAKTKKQKKFPGLFNFSPRKWGLKTL